MSSGNISPHKDKKSYEIDFTFKIDEDSDIGFESDIKYKEEIVLHGKMDPLRNCMRLYQNDKEIVLELNEQNPISHDVIDR